MYCFLIISLSSTPGEHQLRIYFLPPLLSDNILFWPLVINLIASVVQAKLIFLFSTFITPGTMASKCYYNKLTINNFF